MKKRTIALMLALVLVIGCAIGGTIAWLTDKTAEVKNTFSPSTIDITLTETDTDPDTEGAQHNYDMVPGGKIDKDPVVTVEAGSEACYLFVEVVKSANFDDFMTYEMADGWFPLTDKNEDGVADDGVYYRHVDATTDPEGAEYHVLANDQVTVKNSVTKEMMDGLTETTYPTLTFIAYASQSANVDDVATAWANISNPTAEPTPETPAA